jgi:hypothetical protein
MFNMDLHSYGPLIKGMSLLFLSYMALYKNLEIPTTFFILYAIGSFIFVSHLSAIEEKNSSVALDAGIYEQYFNIMLCSYVIYILYNKNKSVF